MLEHIKFQLQKIRTVLITAVPGTLTITPRAIIATLDNQSTVYGNALVETLTYTLDDESYRGELALAVTKAEGLNVGTYAITATSTNLNFALTVVPATYKITPRPITVTIDDKEITYEQANVGLTYTLSEEIYRGQLNLSITKTTW